MNIDILLERGAKMPVKAHDTDGGFDFFTPIAFTLPPRGSASIETGVHMIIPKGWGGLFVSKSGLHHSKDIETTGYVDAHYTGNIRIKLQSHCDREYHFNKGDKISQMIILPVPEVELVEIDELPKTERGNRGFGSTGR